MIFTALGKRLLGRFGTKTRAIAASSCSDRARRRLAGSRIISEVASRMRSRPEVKLTRSGHIVASGVGDQGVEHGALARRLLEKTLRKSGAGPGDIGHVVATGYTRNAIDIADTTITEITCHARGVRHLVPDAATIIEIGGQDSKLLRLGPNGTVRDFAVNHRCAAGTGRFLEVVATRLSTALDELGGLAARSVNPAPISSMCVVFAETEIIGLLAAMTSPEDIVAGVQVAIAARVSAMVGGSIVPPIVFTGGVAMIPGMAEALGHALGRDVRVAPMPQFTGALGAALLGAPCRPDSVVDPTGLRHEETG